MSILKKTFNRKPWTAVEQKLLIMKCQETRDCSVNGRCISWAEVVQFFGGTRDYSDCKACWRRICDREMRFNAKMSRLQKDLSPLHISQTSLSEERAQHQEERSPLHISQTSLSEKKKQHQEELSSLHIPDFARFKSACMDELFYKYEEELMLPPLEQNDFQCVDDWFEKDLY